MEFNGNTTFNERMLLMKKVYVVFVTIVLLIISFFVGQYIYKISKIDDNLLAKAREEYAVLQEKYETELQAAAANDNTRISPNAVLIFKTEYNKCGHILNKYQNASQNEVNLNKKQLQEKYKNWEIIGFTEKEVVLLQKVEEGCNQHYVIREKDGNLAVYIIDENNNESLEEITNISTEYLTQLDLLKLEDGIRVNGLEELNAKLEDFE